MSADDAGASLKARGWSARIKVDRAGDDGFNSRKGGEKVGDGVTRAALAKNSLSRGCGGGGG